jgi:hypothetical protein
MSVTKTGKRMKERNNTCTVHKEKYEKLKTAGTNVTLTHGITMTTYHTPLKHTHAPHKHKDKK